MAGLTEAEQATNQAWKGAPPEFPPDFTQAQMTLRDVLNPNVTTVSPAESIFAAARQMCSHNVSGVVVVVSGDEPVGLVSLTDVLTRVILPRKNAAGTPVSEVMSSPVLPIPPDYSVFTASRIMAKMHIHRLMVRDARQVCGVVSQTDILQAMERRLAEEQKCGQPVVGSDMPTFMLDLEGVITYRNAAFLRLLDCEADDDVLGASFLRGDFWARSQDESLLRQTLRRGRSDLLRVTVRTGPQAAKPILLLLAALKNDAGETAGWQGVAAGLTRIPIEENDYGTNDVDA